MKDNLTHSNTALLANEVDKLASQCVKCALCLPHCPTYVLTEDENESPRGRIALFQAIAQSKLELTAKADAHLERCLGCRACERVCPAHVEYGFLLTQGRELNVQLPAKDSLPKPHFATKLLSWLARKPKAMRFTHQSLWVLQKLGLRQLGVKLGIPRLLGVSQLEKLLPNVDKPLHFASTAPAKSAQQGQVQLFSGCMTQIADQETLAASIHVLQHLGYEVLIPNQQNCCGAIDLHAGQQQKAHTLAQQNIGAFSAKFPIITLATGCSSVLQEYNKHFSGEDVGNFSAQIIDIVTFLQQLPEFQAIPALPTSVILHTPCTRRNVLKSVADPEQLLRKIPELTLTTISNPRCCGAAGTYMLEHPDLANPLADAIISEIRDQAYLVTTNIGCALHLKQRLEPTNPGIKVVHPVTLVAKALGFEISSTNS